MVAVGPDLYGRRADESGQSRREWADRLFQAGIAGEAVGGHKLQALSLVRAISFAERADVVARAREVGERMRQEDGLGVAVKAMEALLVA